MNLLSPQPVTIPAAASVPFSFEIKDSLGVTMSRVLSILLPLEQGADGKRSVEFKIQDIYPTPQQISVFFSLDSLIKVCVTNAESINSQMRSIVRQELCKDQDCRDTVVSMDFMKLKDYLMNYLKKGNISKSIPSIDTPEKFKNFRRDFNSFITDRNIYTHGELRFNRASQEFVTLFQQHGVPAYVTITIESMVSFNEFYKTLRQFLNDFHTAVRKSQNKELSS
jgi:hypothetical protein